MLLTGEFLASVGVMIFDVSQNSLMLMLIPHDVRSRVVGVSRFFNYGTRPFGALLGGVLGAAIGLRPTLWVAVIGCLFGVVFLLASPMPRMREEDIA
jgi:predicted MFS family arabinose efflux permease